MKQVTRDRWVWLLWGVVIMSLAGCTATVTTNQGAPGTAPPAPNVAAGDGQPDCGSPATSIPGACVTEDALAAVVQYLTFFAELCGALVIGVAAMRGLLRFLPHIFGHQGANETYTEDIRLQIGKSLALALEFELGADILKTAVAPSFTIIAQLAAIAILRTFLNYFLEQELRQTEQRRAGHHLVRDSQAPQSNTPAEEMTSQGR